MGRLMNTVHWKRYLDWTRNNRIKRFVESRGNHVFWQISQNIRKADSNNKESLTMVVHEHAPSAIRIPKEDYMEVMNLCIKWFEINEDYETCEKIVKYRSSMTSNKKKIKETTIETKL